MELYGIEKLSLVDYDGKVAATVFTGTCNFKCGFCHNGPLVTSVDKLEITPLEEVFDYLKKRKGIIEGICVTGGEPTLQKDLPEFCESLKKLNLAVKVDTNGTNPDMVKLLANEKLVDYFAMDIKNDKENYAEIIGYKTFDTSKIQRTIDFFLSGGADYEFRTTLIAEYHKKENIVRIGEWIKGANKYFMQKFKATDTCISKDLHGVEENDAKEFLKSVSPFVKKASLRGY